MVAERVPELGRLHQVIGLFPKMDFGEVAVVPAVAHDAVLRRRLAGEIVGLRGAGDGREGGGDPRERAAPAELRQARGVPDQERFREADDIDDGEPVHAGSISWLSVFPSAQLVNGGGNGFGIHRVDFHAAADFRQQGDGELAAQVLAEFFQAG